jgi:hypothetical protein
MKFHSALLALNFAIATLPALSASAAADGFKDLFNGEDLSGWDGLPGFWSVRDGAITGQTTAEKTLKANTFLVWQGGEVKNFELRVSFRLLADNSEARANSGIQFRSKVIDPATWAVAGYQADLEFTRPYLGMLYEERGRGIMMKPGESVRISTGADGKHVVEVRGTPTTPAAVAAAYQKSEWNDMVIIAEGDHIRQFLNGVLTADVIDLDAPRAATSGVLALQLHTGQAMTIQFKYIRLKALP